MEERKTQGGLSRGRARVRPSQALKGGTSMESRAKALGHPIHQMLIPFPFGLLSTAVVFVMILFAVSLWMRYSAPAAAFTREPTTVAVVIALAAFALAGATAWLGGELVDRLGVGVDDGANLDAPNSLTTDSARGDTH